MTDREHGGPARRIRAGFSARRFAVSALFTLPLLTGCDTRVVNPAGPAARSITDLWWFMFAIALVVFGVVVATLAFALFRKRTDDDQGPGLARHLVTWAGAIAPGIIVLGLMTYNTYVSVDLEEPPTEPGVVVAVDAYQWWWRVEYPELGFVTANEVNVPVGQPLVVRLYSADVIHSFWVPQLQGKRDLMPDFQGTMWMQADRAGAYRGQCAEFCGLQHAKMQFLVIAHEQQEWEAWLQAHQQPPAVPTSGQAFRGLQVFLGSECVYCHTVRGTNATGTLGPDLTDLATRRELGAGTVLNTRGNLAAWIIDSQRLKPGNKMPPMPMPGPDLVDLLAYMETLR